MFGSSEYLVRNVFHPAFSIIIFPFLIPKFLETKKIFEKEHQKISAAAAESQKKIEFFQPPPPTKKQILKIFQPPPPRKKTNIENF